MGEKMNVSDYLEKVGKMRRYQWMVITITGLLVATFASQMLIIIFSHADQDFRCLDAERENLTAIEPCDAGNQTANGANCTRNKRYDNKCSFTYLDGDASVDRTCKVFEYDTTVYSSTVLAEFNLICDRTHLATIIDTTWMVSEMVGSLLGAYLCDRFGRKFIIVMGMLNYGIFGIVVGFSQSEIMYMVVRCIIAVTSSVGFIGSISLLLEITAPSKRTHAVNVLTMFWIVGSMLLPLLAFLIPNWRHLQIITSAITLPAGIASFWLLDESPHWLLINGKREKALESLRKIARWNGIHPPAVSAAELVVTDETHRSDEAAKEREKRLVSETGQEGDKSMERGQEGGEMTESCCRIWTHRLVLGRLAIFAFGWTACNFSYYGLSFGVGELPGSVYVNMLLMASVEAVAYLVCFNVAWWGRKIHTVTSFMGAGISLLAMVLVMALAKEKATAVIVLSLFGKFFVTGAWQIMYIWASECFPTTRRALLITIVALVGRIGSVLAPILLDLKKYAIIENVELIIPTLFVVLTLGSGFLHLIPPETNMCEFPANFQTANVHRFPKIGEDKSDGPVSDEELDDRKLSDRKPYEEKEEETEKFLSDGGGVRA